MENAQFKENNGESYTYEEDRCLIFGSIRSFVITYWIGVKIS